MSGIPTVPNRNEVAASSNQLAITLPLSAQPVDENNHPYVGLVNQVIFLIFFLNFKNCEQKPIWKIMHYSEIEIASEEKKTYKN